MQTYTLRRTGEAPLEFEGELLALANSRQPEGLRNNRWHELALYRSESGYYLVEVVYRTQWQGELDHHQVAVCVDAGGVPNVLQRWDPCRHVDGYPPGEQYADRQARLISALTAGYQMAVSDLLAEAGWTEEPIPGDGQYGVALWYFPEEDFGDWREMVGSPVVDSYADYCEMLDAAAAMLHRSGHPVRRVTMPVAEMRRHLIFMDLPNTPAGRAAVTALNG